MTDLDRGTYEVVRDRLLVQARELREKAEVLNESRLELFGGMEMAIVGSERIRTSNNCVPRDIAGVGDLLIFGYNFFLGLRSETTIQDVFSLYRYQRSEKGFALEPVSLGRGETFLEDSGFKRDFRELYQYYKSARLLQLRRVGEKLLAVFQAGSELKDIRVFRWRLSPDGTLRYLDNRGERDHEFPPAHDFEWTATGRDNFVLGRHPHVSIQDEVFVEAVGGDLTVKIEDNTGDGLGIYREPVEDADQSLDDGEIHYARLGALILLKVLPYREENWRYLVFNTRNQTVQRIDAIGQACVQLPEDHGIIFPGGFYLQTGEFKTFDGDTSGLEFKRSLRSPNGEDVLYLFHRREEGRTVMLPYNVIRKAVANPIDCHGFTFFDDGAMVVFRTLTAEATRVHPMQIWQTPFTSEEFAAAVPTSGSYLEKVGNADLVRGISDVLSLCRLVEEQAPSRGVYEDLIATVQRTLDQYHWLGAEEAGSLLTPVQEVRATAETIVGEFEKAEAIRLRAQEAVAQAAAAQESLLRDLQPEGWTEIEPFVQGLSALRHQRGQLITLRDLRSVDRERLDALEQECVERFDAVSAGAVELLSGAKALAPFHTHLSNLEGQISTVAKVKDAVPLRQELDEIGSGLDLLSEVVAALPIDDATVRTAILEGLSEVLGELNRTRALLTNRRKELLSKEAVAEFGVQVQLFTQSVTSGLAQAETPEACDEQLSRLLLQLEDLEGRFSEFDDYLEQLATQREEVYEAFGAKKQRLVDQRQRRAEQLATAAQRILDGVQRRSSGLADEVELNAYFAADPMIGRLRELVERLRELGDSVRADEVDMRLKASRQDAARSLRDRKDLFEEGAEVIRLGRHRFSVNRRPLELTLLPRGEGLELHLTGTDFYQTAQGAKLEGLRDCWQQLLISESAMVYRAEFLAANLLAAAEENRDGWNLTNLAQSAASVEDLLQRVRQAAAERYDEGYERGIHDVDAARILRHLISLVRAAGLLRFSPSARAAAALFWAFQEDHGQRDSWHRRAASLLRLRRTFQSSPEIGRFAAELGDRIAAFFEHHRLTLDTEDAQSAGHYLLEELGQDRLRLVLSSQAEALREAFRQHLDGAGALQDFQEDLRQLDSVLGHRFALVEAWMEGFLDAAGPEASELRPALAEAIALELTAGRLDREVSSALTTTEVDGLLGQHPRIQQGTLTLRLDEFLDRLGRYRHHQVPRFRAFQKLRHELLERERSRLRLAEFHPRVLSSFVRNRLIDEVYLPLIGDNLAKQIGGLGEGKRTDQMGLLLLVSPPGYGKTTLMEYVANRLGLVFMKVNGPALGHGIRSLDPAEASNATARREVEKINLAFEMGNNVLLYLDDIQHTHPELLQKFISLCDAQRKVEGVWRGETKTYDLRGKRFAVCMAGNPYTESGETFRIPDMLANRADVYNLGDILEGKDDLFALSYIENALTSNPVLAPLSTREPKDVHMLVRMARGEALQADQLSHDYSSAELEEILSVLRKLLRVQQLLLQVNQQYILSAAQEVAYRTEPPFQLQGSYRNMNRLAEKIVPVLNEQELEALLDDHYVGEAQTLTGGAEHNLLKLAQLRGHQTEEQKKRWQEILRGFSRVQAMGGSDEDPTARVVGQLGLMADRLGEIGTRVAEAAQGDGSRQGEIISQALQGPLESLATVLAAQQDSKGKGKGKVEGEAAKEEAASISAHLATVTEKLDLLGRVIARSAKALQTSAKKKAEAAEKAPAASAEVPAPSYPARDLSPYLDRLGETLQALAEAPQGREIVQTLGPGVHTLLGDLVTTVEEALIPSVRSLGRRFQDSEEAADRRLRDQLDKTLKGLDQLKELAGALRKIEMGA